MHGGTRISFTGTTNCSEQPYVNTATFRDTHGNYLTIDRDITEYTINDDGTFTMEWCYCYVWDGENADYDVPDLDAFISIEIEDDAPDDYQLEVDASQVFVNR